MTAMTHNSQPFQLQQRLLHTQPVVDLGRSFPRLTGRASDGQLRQGIPIDAIAIHDKGPAIAGFLRRNGDPYAAIGDDSRSRVQLSLGASGVPETFLIDGRGRIVRQYIGDIRPDQVEQIVRDVAAAR